MLANEKDEEQREKNKFNNQTNSTKVQDQNQTHNSRKEGLGQNNNKR